MIIWIILAVLFFVSCLVGGGYSVGFQDGYNVAKEELNLISKRQKVRK